MGRRRLEFADFAILVNFKFLFDWLSFESPSFGKLRLFEPFLKLVGLTKFLIEIPSPLITMEMEFLLKNLKLSLGKYTSWDKDLSKDLRVIKI